MQLQELIDRQVLSGTFTPPMTADQYHERFARDYEALHELNGDLVLVEINLIFWRHTIRLRDVLAILARLVGRGRD